MLAVPGQIGDQTCSLPIAGPLDRRRRIGGATGAKLVEQSGQPVRRTFDLGCIGLRSMSFDIAEDFHRIRQKGADQAAKCGVADRLGELRKGRFVDHRGYIRVD